MNRFRALVQRLNKAMEVPGLSIPAAAVKLFRRGDDVPLEVETLRPHGITVTSCHAIRSAMMGDAVYLTQQGIGCIAAAISLGLVEQDRSSALEGHRVYTELMRKSSGLGIDFVPPSPLEFTDGTVYACKDSRKGEYALFGKDDSGRYEKIDIACRAVSDMMSLQPPTMQGILYFSPDFDEIQPEPDIVLLSLRPVELCRLIQGYQFITGKRVRADVGGLRAGCSDLIVRPYLTGEMNFSPYCLGARLIAKFEGDRMGMGMPYSVFEILVRGTEESVTGFPFPQYPGASP